VVSNVLSNALKFTPAGGAVTVAVERLADGGAALRVSDTGIGIAEADIPRILTPFVQVESTMTRQHAGTGLGLPIAKALAEMHGGELSIESTPGHGTCFTVDLPLGPRPGRRNVGGLTPRPPAARISRVFPANAATGFGIDLPAGGTPI
jgi:signal transduction histidine kinase